MERIIALIVIIPMMFQKVPKNYVLSITMYVNGFL
jgi:hypothetical protein